MNEIDDAKEYVATVGVISSIASGTEEPFFIIGLDITISIASWSQCMICAHRNASYYTFRNVYVYTDTKNGYNRSIRILYNFVGGKQQNMKGSERERTCYLIICNAYCSLYNTKLEY